MGSRHKFSLFGYKLPITSPDLQIAKLNCFNLTQDKMPTEVDLPDVATRPCRIQIKKLSEANGDYKKSDLIITEKLTKEEKALLLPKKSANSKNEKTTAKKRGRQKKGDKFHLKISGYFSPKSVSKVEEEDEELNRSRQDSGDRPDSGFASRSETPAVWSESGSKVGSPVKDEDEVLDDDMEAEKNKFLDDLSKDSDEYSDDDSGDDWDGDDSDDGFEKAAKKPLPTKKATKGRAAALAKNVPIIPGALKSEMSAYEKVRDDNIKERQAMLAALMADFSDFKAESGLGSKSKGQPKKKRRLDGDGNYGSGVQLSGERRSSTRLSKKPEDKDSLGSNKYESEDFRDPEKKFRLAEEDSDYDEDDYKNWKVRTEGKKRTNKGKWASDPNENILMPESVSKSMLDKVAQSFGKKVYNQ